MTLLEMKKGLFYVLSLMIFLSACNASSSEGGTERRKGSEDPLLERYSRDLTANATTQAQVDQNLIVNYLIDSLLDFKRTPSGIYYQMQKEGTGISPTMASKVKAHYHGTLLDGRVFDSSVEKGAPLEFGLGQVIRGWQETIPMLKEGGKGTFIIPSHLAYGPRQRSALIKANSVLVFDIELIEVQ